MLSYSSIREQELPQGDVNLLMKTLFHRGKLIMVKDNFGVKHVLWTGALDSNSPAYPCSTSVKVGSGIAALAHLGTVVDELICFDQNSLAYL